MKKIFKYLSTNMFLKFYNLSSSKFFEHSYYWFKIHQKVQKNSTKSSKKGF